MPLSVPRDVITNAAEAWGLPSTLSVGARTFLPLEKSRRRSPSLTAPSGSNSSTGAKWGQRESRAVHMVASGGRYSTLAATMKAEQSSG